MFTNITIGRYIYKDSIIHKLNPFIKLLDLLIISLISMIGNIYINLFVLIFTIFLILLTKIDYKLYLKNIYGFRYFLIVIIILDALTRTNILLNILKIIINLLITSVFMYTTSIKEINYALNTLLSPLKAFKININKISIIITISIKFIFLVFEETDILLKSYKNRGLDFKGDIQTRLFKIKEFLVSLFKLLLVRADNISNTLEVRNCNLDKIDIKYNYKINIIEFLSLDILIIIGVIICAI